MLEALQSHFSNEPPLYSKPRPKSSAGPSPGPSPALSSPSAAMGGAMNPDHGHVHTLSQTPLPPRLPPKPFSPGPNVVVPPASGSGIAHAHAAAPSLSSTPSASQPPSQSSPASHLQTHAPSYSSYASHTPGADIRANVSVSSSSATPFPVIQYFIIFNFASLTSPLRFSALLHAIPVRPVPSVTRYLKIFAYILMPFKIPYAVRYDAV